MCLQSASWKREASGLDPEAIHAPEISDQISAYSLQQDTLLYTLDCVLLALADDLDATLATFDGELLDNGAVEPSDLIA